MLKCSEKTDAETRRHADAVTWRNALRVCLLILTTALGATACRYDMQDQPKMKPYRGTTFFADGLSARQPIQGTVARGYLREDTEYFTGKRSATTASPRTQAIQGQQAQVPGQENTYPDDIDYFPIPVTEEVVKRGRERYDIFCSACHGFTGNGDGMIVRRGFRRAASFNDDRLRQAPVGHFFDAITNGWGAMPAYATQVAVQDRWAIIAYIRALQESQRNIAAESASPSPTASPAPSPGGQQ